MKNAVYRTHSFTYRHDGAVWTIELQATDATDARARIGKLAYATYDGEVVAEWPAFLTPIGIISVWARNTAISIVRRFRNSG